MTPTRLTVADDRTLKALSDLCMRSKAHWGYDAAFMNACKEVLRVTRDDLSDPLAVVKRHGDFAGVVRVKLDRAKPELAKLFVCPNHMRAGVGTALLRWAKAQARAAGHDDLRVESDPAAAEFYKAHGAILIGEAPSEVIPNRVLPLFRLPTHPT